MKMFDDKIEIADITLVSNEYMRDIGNIVKCCKEGNWRMARTYLACLRYDYDAFRDSVLKYMRDNDELGNKKE